MANELVIKNGEPSEGEQPVTYSSVNDTDITGMKTKTDHLTVTAATNLDTMRIDVSGSKSKTDLIEVTQTRNLDTMASDIAGKENALGNPAANGYVLASQTDGSRSWVPQSSGGGGFTKYVVDENNTPFTVPDWGAVLEIKNAVSDIEIILPTAGVSNEGDELKVWIEHNTANHKVLIKAPNTSHVINGIAADGAEVAKAEIKSNNPNYNRLTVQAMGENDVNISNVDSVYNALRYVANFSSTSIFSPYSYLQLSAIPSNFMTNNASWWFAVKVEKPMTVDSNAQVLFGSNNFFIAYQGDGKYFLPSSISGYLQTVSPQTIVEVGEWIIYTYDHNNDEFSAWINGVKVLNATSSGTTPPSTPPTEMWFGSEEGQTTPPSGYGYPLRQCDVSNISIGSGLLSDTDAALFTSATFNTSGLSLTGGTLTNQWLPADGNAMTTETGAINLSLVGPSIGTSEI